MSIVFLSSASSSCDPYLLTQISSLCTLEVVPGIVDCFSLALRVRYVLFSHQASLMAPFDVTDIRTILLGLKKPKRVKEQLLGTQVTVASLYLGRAFSTQILSFLLALHCSGKVQVGARDTPQTRKSTERE